MKVSIGILAHNEATTIRKTLESLLQQTIFQPGERSLELEIVGVPNGCRDNTAEVMRRTFAGIINPVDYPQVTWKICELAQPGKPNAWNHYVHELADPQADYMFLMDADIWFPEPYTLGSMLNVLEQDPYIWVAVDRPVKDVVLKQNKNLIDHLSSFVSELSGSGGAVWLCGQLYCARASILRQIYMPSELTADDGFLYQMVTTNCLTTPIQRDRIARAPDALHVFEAYTHPRQLLKHERWLVVANITNTLIFEHLHTALKQLPSDRSASSLFREWDQQNPRWVANLIHAERTKQSGWLSPPEYLVRRFINLHNKPLIKMILLFPLAFVAMCVDLLALCAANRELSKV
ncbi:glycosyltransferase [filamentous cyanobacterium LEGE 11480]|uniref:Glycosyltransferase n=1 Tax=Romeriopsis navalis LEGE 11480 TaxID=2777977 RepID=A0A928VPV5_9CYAN|nr:glycosyltransferase [Romeriopsis navalis]MBE9030415.1 glycosyltransferase [Romeriopsis navalis LEGE 11480]